jgi:hypothetical protein
MKEKGVVILSPFASLRINSAKNLTRCVILNEVKDLLNGEFDEDY